MNTIDIIKNKAFLKAYKSFRELPKLQTLIRTLVETADLEKDPYIMIPDHTDMAERIFNKDRPLDVFWVYTHMIKNFIELYIKFGGKYHTDINAYYINVMEE